MLSAGLGRTHALTSQRLGLLQLHDNLLRHVLRELPHGHPFCPATSSRDYSEQPSHNKRSEKPRPLQPEIRDDSGGRGPLIIKDLDLYPQPPTNTRSPTLNSEEPVIDAAVPVQDHRDLVADRPREIQGRGRSCPIRPALRGGRQVPSYVTKLLSFDLLVVLAVSESGYVPLMAGMFRYSYK